VTPDLIYHITSGQQWSKARAAGEYRGDTLETEGFIHASVARQVVRVANRFYAGRSGLVLLCINTDKVRPEVRYEPADDGDRFPHIYGPLNVDAVVETLDFPAAVDGTFQLPSNLNHGGAF
jgi:uncharacterized protein (DUF952 family)